MKAVDYRVGLYMRLSKDDYEGSRFQTGICESSSISNQRDLLTVYAKDHGYPVVAEYSDDGFSGTNFDRPAFQKMICDIEQKKINLILTKDLSRLGRDYILTGQYTEVYFPSKKVRCIAVNDGFDSDSLYNDIAPFKHVVNEMYARDASKKIRSAFASKMQKGSYIGNFAPYGYRKDPENKNHLLPDTDSARVVQQIFTLAEDGAAPSEIAERLNQEHILTPAVYRCRIPPGLEEDCYSKRKEWTAASVSKLLHNIVYLGHMAQGKTSKVSFKSREVLKNAREDWIVVENTHEPLVGRECFETVQRSVRGRTCYKKGQFHNLFSGIARCADCGKNMSAVGSRKKGSPMNLACGGYKLNGKQACSNHFIDYKVLYGIVLDAVREEAALTEDEWDEIWKDLRNMVDTGNIGEKLFKMCSDKAKVERLIEQLYDDKLQDRISGERFYKLLEKYEIQCRELDRKLGEHCRGGGVDVSGEECGLLAEVVRGYRDIAELDSSLLYGLIDHIEVAQGRYEGTGQGRTKFQNVRIYFRFSANPKDKVYIV